MKKELFDEAGNQIDLSDVITCVGAGWHKLVVKLVEDLWLLGWDGKVNQVKEKFGGLRFYIDYQGSAMHPSIRDRITRAEIESMVTCEACGRLGKERGGGWIKTLCAGCHSVNEMRKEGL